MTGPGIPPGSSLPPRPPGKEAVFLGRGSYRQRRYRDLSRFLPVLGAVLFALPLLWPRGTGADGAAAATSGALIYLFVVWAVLIFGAFLLSRVIRYGDADREEEAPGTAADGAGAPRRW